MASFTVELSESSGRPGDVIEAEGEGLLTCCPQNTPVPDVRLLLVTAPGAPSRPESSVVLFEGVAADQQGALQTSFPVPDIPVGTYELQACAAGPPSMSGPGEEVCMPIAQSFTVLAASDRTSWTWVIALAIGLLLGTASGWTAHAHRRKHSEQTER